MWIKRGLALGLCLVLMGLCAWHIFQTDDALQYVFLSPTEPEQDPEKPTPTALHQLMKQAQLSAEDWQETYASWALTSRNESVQLAGENGGTATVTLQGLWGSTAALPPMLARFGRCFYQEELQDGSKVMLITEELAIALFRTGDPVDRLVQVGEDSYRVIGILRQGRSVGDHDAYTAYVPLLALDAAGYQTQTLTLSARPVEGAGAANRFAKDMETFYPGGEAHLLAKEQARALLPLRVLAVATGFGLVLMLSRRCKSLALDWYRAEKVRLESSYLSALLPRMVLEALAALAMGAALLLALYALVQLALEPVYTFPEWVPAVPVEWSDIVSTFWNNQTAANRIISLRTSQSMTLDFFRQAMMLVCTLCGLMLARLYGQWRGQQKAKERK